MAQYWFDRRTVRVVTNRQVFDKLELAVTDGLFELAKAVVFDANPPRDTGQLAASGGVIAYHKGKEVGNASTGSKKPTAKWIGSHSSSESYVVGGYAHPAAVVEFGTVTTRAQPFLTPSLMRHVPDAGPFISLALVKAGLVSEAVGRINAAAARGDHVAARAAGRTIRAVERAGPQSPKVAK